MELLVLIIIGFLIFLLLKNIPKINEKLEMNDLKNSEEYIETLQNCKDLIAYIEHRTEIAPLVYTYESDKKGDVFIDCFFKMDYSDAKRRLDIMIDKKYPYIENESQEYFNERNMVRDEEMAKFGKGIFGIKFDEYYIKCTEGRNANFKALFYDTVPITFEHCSYNFEQEYYKYALFNDYCSHCLICAKVPYSGNQLKYFTKDLGGIIIDKFTERIWHNNSN